MLTAHVERYIALRQTLGFRLSRPHSISTGGWSRIASSMVNYTFRRVLRLAGVGPARTWQCWIVLLSVYLQ